ncbi:MAG: carboxypeptidase regulatory-like domain-containing protein [Pyrinomonadaceae bacterium]|nr:carboxypeptidase regulatory-like domain-containing protein [Pyrinomonadaceae bacterium]
MTSLISWRQDTRTRVILFALNLNLQPGEEPSSVTAVAEDGLHRQHSMDVEYVRPVPGHQWMSAVCLRLNDQMEGVGDVLVRISHQGRASNRVRIAIGHRDGGPLDDPGSHPTPAPPYVISGRITVDGNPLAGATVSLSGSASASTLTDTAGNYSILAASAADYLLSASKEDYIFEPPIHSLLQIDGDRHVNFIATLNIVLSGRISNTNDQGVFGVKITWSGPQSGETFTRSDGTYSFVVASLGNYTLIPSKAQDYYSFTPATSTLTGLGESRVANFTAALNLSLSPSYVLEFDGAPKSVDHSMPLPGDYNLFWPDGLDYGHFFWEFWAMPGNNAGGTYLVSDGYGGAHALLFGVSHIGAREPGRYQLAGNIWNGTRLTSFGSDEGPAPNEWGHFAVGWDGSNIIVYFNGVPVGKTLFVGPRITPGGSHGTGRLLIGGSDHANFRGRIAQVRGYETYNPREAIGSSVFATFAPQTVFSVDGSLLSYFFRPSNNIADLSLYGQYGRQHPGLVRSTANGVLHPCPECPLPEFVIDPTAPDFANPHQPGFPPAPVETPANVPNGALIFDSFSRRNSTYALGGVGGLGSSERGEAGPKTWRTNAAGAGPQPFGILNGRGVLLANAEALTWLNMASGGTNFDIRTDRRPRNSGTGHNTGISFRVVDSNNYFFAYSSDGADASLPQTLTVGHYIAGLRTVLASEISMPSGWTTMRVVTTGAGVVRVYANGTLLYSTNSSLLSNSDGVGLYNNGPGLALTNRWDNFRVFVADP